MKKILYTIISIFLFSNHSVFGQTDYVLKKNTVMFDIGGPGLLYSLNYLREIPFNKFGINLGIGFSPLFFDGIRHHRLLSYTIPIQVNFVYRINRHEFFIGIGETIYHSIAYANPKGRTVFFFEQIGYNYCLKKNLVLGISFIPLLIDVAPLFPWGTLRIGYRF